METRDFEEHKARIKSYLEEYVERVAGPKTRNGMYVCPLCGSGEKRNKTAAFSIWESQGGTQWSCFACGEKGDIYTLHMKLHNCDFNTADRELSEMFREDRPQPERRKQTPPSTSSKKSSTPQPADLEAYFRACQGRRAQTEFYGKRGLVDAALLDRIGAGYDPQKKAAIIPTGEGTYYMHYVNGPVNGIKGLNQPKDAPQHLWNAAALEGTEPVFVTEGALDALSIMQEGGRAVALLGTAQTRLTDLLKEREAKGLNIPPIIVMLDNDQGGEECRDRILTAVSDLYMPIAPASFYLPAKEQGKPLDPETAAIWGRYGDFEAQRGKDPNDLLKESLAAGQASGNNDFSKLIAALTEAAKTAGEAAVEAAKAADKEAFEKHLAASDTGHYLEGIIEDGSAPIATGYPTFDQALGGGEYKGDGIFEGGGLFEGLYLFGAPSSIGKTTFIVQLADQIAAAGHDVIYYTLEMSKRELMAKSVSRYSYKLGQELETPNYAKTTRAITTGSTLAAMRQNWPQEYDFLSKAVNWYNEECAGHIFYIEGVANITADRMRKEVEAFTRLYGRKPVVIVDYLQLVQANDIHLTDKQATDYNVTAFKLLTRDLGLTLIAISSFNRDSYKAGMKGAWQSMKVTESSFKESGGIEYTADVLIGLNYRYIEEATSDKDLTDRKGEDKKRKDYETRAELQLVIIKNRHGGRDKRVNFDFYKLFNTFEDKGEGHGALKALSPPKETAPQEGTTQATNPAGGGTAKAGSGQSGQASGTGQGNTSGGASGRGRGNGRAKARAGLIPDGIMSPEQMATFFNQTRPDAPQQGEQQTMSPEDMAMEQEMKDKGLM